MSATVPNLVRGGTFNSMMTNEELARRCSDFERLMQTQITRLNEVLANKPDKSELVPTAFKDGEGI